MNQSLQSVLAEQGGPQDTYQVIISGLSTNMPASEARVKLATLFKVGAEQIERLLATEGHAVKKGCSLEVATKYKRAIEANGAVCELVREAKPVESLEIDLPDIAKSREPSSPIYAKAKPVDPVADSSLAAEQIDATWRVKFELLAKAGGPKLSSLKDLPFGERRKIIFNVWAFLVGPFYYAAKGMWKKAISLTAVSLALILVVEKVFDSFEIPGAAITNFVAPAIFATRANIDYYKKMVLNDNGWW